MARLNARRSIVVDKPLEIGQRITEDNISCKRPAHGISTKHWDEVLGKTVIKKLEFDHILTWDDID
jgi:sialic acid synthase SpsE